ncbi:DUF4350 domain-containing protein [Kineococcus gypseus]|uniref:DUF4350 domain-containing protein n=1 Tax=Kineococcus gypseus TaxID=1637102 RepID=UPI003D7E86B2
MSAPAAPAGAAPGPLDGPARGPLDGPSAPSAPARAGGTGRRRRRGPVLVGALLVALALLLALLTPRTSDEALAPGSASPEGARALARVLRAQGVQVVEQRTFAGALRAARQAGPGTSVLVTAPSLVSARRWGELAGAGARLLPVEPSPEALEALDAVVPGVRGGEERPARVLPPGCDAPGPAAAGTARAGGRTYALADGAEGTSCYGGSWVSVPTPAGGEVVLLGQADVLTNRHVDERGDAALALWTLGASPVLVWYLPDPLDAEVPEVPLTSLAPPWVAPGAALLLVAAATAVLWRGRRLGRLVPEPLPVVVRAAETVEGHGRLYASAGASGHAGAALRAASLRRLRLLVRLDATAGAADVADQVAGLTGLPARQVLTLLDGPAPAEDAALVRLAGDLDALERRVRPHGP